MTIGPANIHKNHPFIKSEKGQSPIKKHKPNTSGASAAAQEALVAITSPSSANSAGASSSLYPCKAFDHLARDGKIIPLIFSYYTAAEAMTLLVEVKPGIFSMPTLNAIRAEANEKLHVTDVFINLLGSRLSCISIHDILGCIEYGFTPDVIFKLVAKDLNTLNLDMGGIITCEPKKDYELVSAELNRWDSAPNEYDTLEYLKIIVQSLNSAGKYCPHLNTLILPLASNFQEPEIQDKFMEAFYNNVSKWPKLEGLALRAVQSTKLTAALQRLAIQTLELYYSDNLQAPLVSKILGCCRNITRLGLVSSPPSFSNTSEKDVNNWFLLIAKKCPQLKHFHFNPLLIEAELFNTSQELQEGLLTIISSCRHLTSFHLHDTQVNKEIIEAIAFNLRSVKDLSFSLHNIDQPGVISHLFEACQNIHSFSDTSPWVAQSAFHTPTDLIAELTDSIKSHKKLAKLHLQLEMLIPHHDRYQFDYVRDDFYKTFIKGTINEIDDLIKSCLSLKLLRLRLNLNSAPPIASFQEFKNIMQKYLHRSNLQFSLSQEFQQLEVLTPSIAAPAIPAVLEAATGYSLNFTSEIFSEIFSYFTVSEIIQFACKFKERIFKFKVIQTSTFCNTIAHKALLKAFEPFAKDNNVASTSLVSPVIDPKLSHVIQYQLQSRTRISLAEIIEYTERVGLNEQTIFRLMGERLREIDLTPSEIKDMIQEGGYSEDDAMEGELVITDRVKTTAALITGCLASAKEYCPKATIINYPSLAIFKPVDNNGHMS